MQQQVENLYLSGHVFYDANSNFALNLAGFSAFKDASALINKRYKYAIQAALKKITEIEVYTICYSHKLVWSNCQSNTSQGRIWKSCCGSLQFTVPCNVYHAYLIVTWMSLLLANHWSIRWIIGTL